MDFIVLPVNLSKLGFQAKWVVRRKQVALPYTYTLANPRMMVTKRG